MPTPSATPAPGPRGRPPHLLGHLPDGCELLPLSETTSIVGRPLEFDAFMLLQGRGNGSVDCGYTERATFSPKRPRSQVWFRLFRRDSGRDSGGKMQDGCALVPLPEAASLLGLPLELDGRPVHGSRNGDLFTCGYSGRSTRSPKRPRYEVELHVAERLPEPERWQPIPGEPEGRRWRVEKKDGGVSVAATTAHGLSVVARVARRDVSGVYGRTEVEFLTAYHFARLLSMRAQDIAQ